MIAGVTGSSIHHVIERSKYAEQLGISSVMAMPPIGYSSELIFIIFMKRYQNKLTAIFGFKIIKCLQALSRSYKDFNKNN
ncbi:MAG: hypothetical protein Ct9H90mP2_00350 [Dehalococcoidia bacterium]|nr:MAG: hypothetical protein Ct9H90mP2_00350 [Dehalococcoidia bacterium]